jgi:hypothetical protein
MPKANKLRRHRPDLVPPVDEAKCGRLIHFLVNTDTPPNVTPSCPECERVLAEWNAAEAEREARRQPGPPKPNAALPDLSSVPIEVVSEWNALTMGRPAVLDILVDAMRERGVAALTDVEVLARARAAR